MTADRPLPFLTETQFERWLRMPGFLLPSAAERLYRAAAEAPDAGQVVELGSFAGKSLVCLANGVRSRASTESAKLTAIDVSFHDMWQETVDFFELASSVTPIEMSSLDAANLWSDPISLLYIDADHSLAHAVADFVVWEPYVVADGIIALDDTAGYFPGCTLQVQIALSGGRYELIDDVGGVTFLRKEAPLFDGIGFSPLLRGTAFATVAATSAWSGAMDPRLRLPTSPRVPVSEEMIQRRLRTTLASLDGIRTRLAAGLREEVLPTLAYLEAVLRLHLGEHDESLRLLKMLSGSRVQIFFHYDLEIRPLALLRMAQVLDLRGSRNDALQLYGQVLRDCDIEGVRTGAAEGNARAFELPKPVAGRLLREYVLDSPLGSYRRIGPRRPSSFQLDSRPTVMQKSVARRGDATTDS